MAPSRDPEVDALTTRIRALTAQARALAHGIEETLAELTEFVGDVAENRARDRRRSQQPFSGAERRR